ncbi:MAG: Glutathione transport system permease protein GsiD [Burkholderiaceae bacterium]|nr:Glutathione transport system permease protein GsiD [Burkholderiaceae bacterium]
MSGERAADRLEMPAPAARGRWLRSHATLVVSLGALSVIVLAILLLPLVLPDPNLPDPINRLLPPSAAHWLGTDNYGRDVWSRLVSGGRVSLGLAAAVTVAATIVGSLVGLVSGFFRPLDAVLMRLMDAGLAFPGIVLAMALAIVMGAGAWSEFIALTVIFTPTTARVVRSRVLSLATRDFIAAARASGMGSWKILVKHVIPHTLPLIMVQLVIKAALAMLIDGGLSYLGLGVAPPTPTWGNMIAEGRAFMTLAPQLIIAPGLAIVLCVALLNIAGDELRLLVDPDARTLHALERLRSRVRREPRARRSSEAAARGPGS